MKIAGLERGFILNDQGDLSDEMINWCIDNDRPSYSYEEYSKLQNILNKYSNIKYKIESIINNEPNIMIYSENFRDLQTIFNELINHNVITEGDASCWIIAITDNYELYNYFCNKIANNSTLKLIPLDAIKLFGWI